MYGPAAGDRPCGRQISFRVDVQPVERCVTGVTSRWLNHTPRAPAKPQEVQSHSGRGAADVALCWLG